MLKRCRREAFLWLAVVLACPIGMTTAATAASPAQRPAPLTEDRAIQPDPEDFPLLPGLTGNVDFWVSVWSRWSINQAAIHDLEYPGLVYEVVELPGNIEDRYTAEQKEFLEHRRENWEIWLSALKTKVENGTALEEIEQRWADHIRDVIGEDGLAGASERIRSQRGLRERFKAGLERSYRYLGAMRDLFREGGLPQDLAYLPHVESSFQYHARSSVGAAGVWQFTRGTGRKYMKINSAVDERLDPIVATRAAVEFLSEAYDKLGNWPLALTSYNHGVQGMGRAREQFGADFEKIYANYKSRSFGFASKNFYSEFLAAREIARNPQHYFPEGFQPMAPFDLDRTELQHKSTPGRIAKTFGVPIGKLVALNPAWTQRAVRDGLSIPVGVRIWLPPGTLHLIAQRDVADSVPAPESAAAQAETYIVRRGDTLSSIAGTHRTTVAQLQTLNDLPRNGSLIRIGQTLRVRAAGSSVLHRVRRNESLSEIASEHGISLRSLREANGIPAQRSVIHAGQELRVPDGGTPPAQDHVVRRGETLLRIASNYGIRLGDLLTANMLTIRSVIYPGQTLSIPLK